MQNLSVQDVRTKLDQVTFFATGVKWNHDTASISDASADDCIDAVATYSTGIAEILGYELVSFGVSNAEEITTSAFLLYAGFADCIAVDIPREILIKVFPDLPEGVVYKQTVVDETMLDDEAERPEGTDRVSVWTAEGGISFLPPEEFESLFPEFDKIRTQAHAESQPPGGNVSEEVPLSNEQVIQEQKAAIAKDGVSFVCVPSSDTATEGHVLYTVGLTLAGLPEVIVSGSFEPADLAQHVGYVVEMLRNEGYVLRTTKDAFTLVANLDGQPNPDSTAQFDFRTVEIDPGQTIERYMLPSTLVMDRPVARVMAIQYSDHLKRFVTDEGFENIFKQLDFGPIIAS